MNITIPEIQFYAPFLVLWVGSFLGFYVLWFITSVLYYKVCLPDYPRSYNELLPPTMFGLFWIISLPILLCIVLPFKVFHIFSSKP